MSTFQVPWQGSGGNEKFFFENDNVSIFRIFVVDIKFTGRNKALYSHYNCGEFLTFSPGVYGVQCWRTFPY